MPKGMWKLDQKTQDWSTPSFPQEKMIRSCKTMKCVGSKDARLWQGWCRYKGAKCRMYGCVTKVSECPNQTRYAEKTEPRVSMTLRSIENSNHKQEVESQCQNPQGGYERQAGRWWWLWTPKLGMWLWTSNWGVIPMAPNAEMKRRLRTPNQKEHRWMSIWNKSSACSTKLVTRNVMLRKDDSERRKREDTEALKAELGDDDGSEHRNREWDSDGSERQNWKCDSEHQSGKWWWLWTPNEDVMMTLNANWDAMMMALNTDTEKWWGWLWTPILRSDGSKRWY